MEKKRFYISNLGDKKAFIFTMDVAITLIIVFLFLAAATTFVVKSNRDPFPNLQLVKFGSDVMRILDRGEYLDNPDEGVMSAKLQNILPSYYGMQIQGNGLGDCNFLVGDEPPDDRFIASAKYYFKTQNNFCNARYKVWVE